MTFTTTGEPITITYAPGGMRGPEGSTSRESFDQRQKITLNILIQEDTLPLYAQSKEACIELGHELAELLHHYLQSQ